MHAFQLFNTSPFDTRILVWKRGKSDLIIENPTESSFKNKEGGSM